MTTIRSFKLHDTKHQQNRFHAFLSNKEDSHGSNLRFHKPPSFRIQNSRKIDHRSFLLFPRPNFNLNGKLNRDFNSESERGVKTDQQAHDRKCNAIVPCVLDDKRTLIKIASLVKYESCQSLLLDEIRWSCRLVDKIEITPYIIKLHIEVGCKGRHKIPMNVSVCFSGCKSVLSHFFDKSEYPLISHCDNSAFFYGVLGANLVSYIRNSVSFSGRGILEVYEKRFNQEHMKSLTYVSSTTSHFDQESTLMEQNDFQESNSIASEIKDPQRRNSMKSSVVTYKDIILSSKFIEPSNMNLFCQSDQVYQITLENSISSSILKYPSKSIMFISFPSSIWSDCVYIELPKKVTSNSKCVTTSNLYSKLDFSMTKLHIQTAKPNYWSKDNLNNQKETCVHLTYIKFNLKPINGLGNLKYVPQEYKNIYSTLSKNNHNFPVSKPIKCPIRKKRDFHHEINNFPVKFDKYHVLSLKGIDKLFQDSQNNENDHDGTNIPEDEENENEYFGEIDENDEEYVEDFYDDEDNEPAQKHNYRYMTELVDESVSDYDDSDDQKIVIKSFKNKFRSRHKSQVNDLFHVDEDLYEESDDTPEERTPSSVQEMSDIITGDYIVSIIEGETEKSSVLWPSERNTSIENLSLEELKFEINDVEGVLSNDMKTLPAVIKSNSDSSRSSEDKESSPTETETNTKNSASTQTGNREDNFGITINGDEVENVQSIKIEDTVDVENKNDIVKESKEVDDIMEDEIQSVKKEEDGQEDIDEESDNIIAIHVEQSPIKVEMDDIEHTFETIFNMMSLMALADDVILEFLNLNTTGDTQSSPKEKFPEPDRIVTFDEMVINEPATNVDTDNFEGQKNTSDYCTANECSLLEDFQNGKSKINVGKLTPFNVSKNWFANVKDNLYPLKNFFAMKPSAYNDERVTKSNVLLAAFCAFYNPLECDYKPLYQIGFRDFFSQVTPTSKACLQTEKRIIKPSSTKTFHSYQHKNNEKASRILIEPINLQKLLSEQHNQQTSNYKFYEVLKHVVMKFKLEISTNVSLSLKIRRGRELVLRFLAFYYESTTHSKFFKNNYRDLIYFVNLIEKNVNDNDDYNHPIKYFANKPLKSLKDYGEYLPLKLSELNKKLKNVMLEEITIKQFLDEILKVLCEKPKKNQMKSRISTLSDKLEFIHSVKEQSMLPKPKESREKLPKCDRSYNCTFNSQILTKKSAETISNTNLYSKWKQKKNENCRLKSSKKSQKPFTNDAIKKSLYNSDVGIPDLKLLPKKSVTFLEVSGKKKDINPIALIPNVSSEDSIPPIEKILIYADESFKFMENISKHVLKTHQYKYWRGSDFNNNNLLTPDISSDPKIQKLKNFSSNSPEIIKMESKENRGTMVGVPSIFNQDSHDPEYYARKIHRPSMRKRFVAKCCCLSRHTIRESADISFDLSDEVKENRKS